MCEMVYCTVLHGVCSTTVVYATDASTMHGGWGQRETTLRLATHTVATGRTPHFRASPSFAPRCHPSVTSLPPHSALVQ